MFSQEIKKAPQRKSEWKSKKPKRIFMSNAQKGTHFLCVSNVWLRYKMNDVSPLKTKLSSKINLISLILCAFGVVHSSHDAIQFM